MGSGLLGISVSGLNAAMAGLLTTSHNIANASTPGYNRQSIVQATNIPMFTGSGFLGQGTNVQTVQRTYNDLLTTQVLGAQTATAQLQTYSDQITQISNLMADPSAGLSPAIQGFFNALSTAAGSPSSIPARQALLSSGQALASRFQSMDQQLSDIRDGVNKQIQTEVVTINSYVDQLASINQRIVLAQAGGAGQVPNDLLDQRDQLISNLNQEISITSHQESDGSYSVFFGSGQPLVVGAQSYQLRAIPGTEDASELQIGLQMGGTSTTSIPDSLVTGGKLGGLLNFRSNSLNSTQNAIGRLAFAITTNFNNQHALGQDLNGNPGGNFFQPITLNTLGAAINTGTASLAANVKSSDYKVVYGAGGYTITRLSDDTNLGTFAGLPQVVDGVRISATSGVPAVGDTFLIRPDQPDGSRVVTYATNTGNVTLSSSASNLQSLGDSDFRLTMPSANTLVLERLSDGTVWTGQGVSQAAAMQDLMNQSSPIGFTLTLSGTMQSGDSFLIRPTRFAARDMGLAISDPGSIALATPLRTAAGTTNTGTGAISAGSVNDTQVLLSAPFTVSYDAASNSLVGFPIGATVQAGPQTYRVTSATTRIPYASGVNMSLNGVGFVLNGTPANGDTFTINPPPAAPTAGSTGFSSLFGVAPVSSFRGASQGSVDITTLGFPLVLTAGVNDQFNISIDGGAASTVTLGAGPYATPAALAGAVQSAIGGGVVVTLDGTNRLQVTSSTVGGASAIVLSAAGANNGYTNLFGVATSGNQAQSTGAALGSPTVITAGVNDAFRLTLNGGGSQIITLPPGSYSPAALQAQLQAALNAVAAAPGITATLSGGNQLVLMSNLIGSGSSVGLATVNLGAATVGTGTVTATTSLLQAPLTLTYQGATVAPLQPNRLQGFPVGTVVTVTPPGGAPVEYKVSHVTDTVPYTAGATMAFNGIRFSINGSPANGDTFTLGPNPSGIADNRNATLLGKLQTNNALSGATATFQGTYSQIVATIGNQSRAVDVNLSAQQNLVQQGQTAIQSASGVNLDEEAANLLRYQQAYQASAKVINIAGKLFDQLLTLGS
ncbi:MAG: flagellar hook-associated protein FlgK [Proteobacteria bacterium]|nr:flagellar hook-associated protein FlgK [Pseudomonadota bacterium]HQR05001.1 flagellar hook-associated protein FlgK [Rhodocyclaceae bacterium]